MRAKILALALLAPAVALANGYDVPNVNPRDLALVSSGLAAQADAAAAYANPAAMARLGPGLQLSLAGSGLFLSTKWNDTSGQLSPSSASTKFKPVPPVSLFGMYGFKVAGYDAALGAGMNIVAGGNVFWEDGWAGRGRIITVDRKIFAGYLSGGFALSQYIRVGAQAVYYYGVEYLKQGIQPDPTSYGELSTKGGALAPGFSVEVTPDDRLSFAADYKHLGKMKLKGDGNFVASPGVVAASCVTGSTSAFCLQDQGVTHELTYPSVLNVGMAYRVVKPLLVTATWTYNWYEVYQEDVFVGDQGANIPVPRHYGNGQTFRLGAEYDYDARLQLRAGVERDVSGLDTDYQSPTLPDASSWIGAVGAGWMLSPNLQLNATVFYALFDKVTATGTVAMPGSYETNVWITSVGVSWKTGVGGGGR
jgi:long-chain fatty acid transport protein